MNQRHLAFGHARGKASLFCKSVCLFIATVFFLQTAAGSAPANAAPAEAAVRPVSIPESLGRVEKTVFFEGGPVIIHIQDAHAQPEAQNNIAGILQHLAEQGNAEMVFAEGAFGRLDPGVLNLFPSPELNMAMADYLMKLGEFTGVELYALRENGSGLPVYGAEDEKVYAESYRLFREIKAMKDGIGGDLDLYRRALEEGCIKRLNKELHRYLIARAGWDKNTGNAGDYLDLLSGYAREYLSVDLSDPRSQFAWPALTRLNVLRGLEKNFRFEEARQDVERFSTEAAGVFTEEEAAYFNGVLNALAADAGESLQTKPWMHPDHPGVISLRTFMEELYRRGSARGVLLDRYPHLLQLTGIQILHEEIDARMLLEETDALAGLLEEKLAASPEEKKILELSRDLKDLGKLLSLEITRKEYGRYLSRRSEAAPESLKRRFEEALEMSGGGLPLISGDAVNKAEEFYRLSRRRDEILLDNALENIKRSGSRSAVLITGGFHSDGLVQLMEERKISFAVLSPRMSSRAADGLYEKAMMGENARLDGLASSGIVKSLFLQPADTYELGGIKRDEQKVLVLKALRDTVRRRMKNVPRADVYRLLAGAARSSEILNGTRVIYDETNDAIDLVVPLEEGTLRFSIFGDGAAAAPAQETGPAFSFERPETVSPVRPSGAGFRNIFLFLAAGPAAAGVVFLGRAMTAGRSELREIPLSTHELPAEEELKLLEQIVLPELIKARAGLPSALPEIGTFSDLHGAIERIDQLLVDRILNALPGLEEARRNEIGEAVLARLRADPFTTLAKEFSAFGIDLVKEMKGRIIFENLGDLTDRGDNGIQVFWRSEELYDSGLSSFITGNHDLYALMSLMGFHLPWYEGFEFYGYEDRYGSVKELVDRFRVSDPENAASKGWWARRMAEYVRYQKARQKNHWSRLDSRVNGKGGMWDRLQRAGPLTPEQKKVWDKLRGWYLVKVSTGVRAAGQMSLQWWHDLLDGRHDAPNEKENFKGFRELYAELERAEGFDPSSEQAALWRAAIEMIEKEVLEPLEKDFRDKVELEGEWWWRVFDAINYRNYASPEWYALDWSIHGDEVTGWGRQVFADLTRLNRRLQAERPDAFSGSPEVTLENYLDDIPATQALRDMRDFYLRSFNLYLHNIYQTKSMHGFLPVEKEGPYRGMFRFDFNGETYRGNGQSGKPSIWEGMNRIAEAVKKPGNRMRDYHEPFRVVTEWYADMTTESKPKDIAYALNTFGPEGFAELNGIDRLATGHVPPLAFAELSEAEKRWIKGFLAAEKFALTDRGPARVYGGWGGIVVTSPKAGYRLRGFEQAGSDELLDDPRMIMEQGGPEAPFEVILSENPGVSGGRFLDQAIGHVQARIETLKGRAAQAGKSELREVMDAGKFMQEVPQRLAAAWRFNFSQNRSTLVAVSGGEVSGKTFLTRALRSETSAALADNSSAHVKVLSLDRFFLDRHRRHPGKTRDEAFYNKWDITPESDRAKKAPGVFTVRAALEALRSNQAAYVPFFINRIKQRLRVSPTASYTDPKTGNIPDGKVSELERQIASDLALLEKYLLPDQILEHEGRRLIKPFNSSGRWTFHRPEDEGERERMKILHDHMDSGLTEMGILMEDEIDLNRIVIDAETGDILEIVVPQQALILVEGVISMSGEVVDNPKNFYDERIWVSVGEPGAEQSDPDIRRVEHWRYLVRRFREGRITTAQDIIDAFDRRHDEEFPVIAAARNAGRIWVNTATPQEKTKLEELEEVVPVIIAFDVGGGRIGLSHQVLALDEDNLVFRYEGGLQDEVFEPTRSREGPNKEGKDKVLGQVAIMTLERVRQLRAHYPGKEILPVVAIGAPGNKDHPRTDGAISPHSADNLGADLGGVNPVQELQDILEVMSGIRPPVVWNNDSLAQAYAAVRQLLPRHEEYLDDAVLFLSIGTGVGMGVVKVDAEGNFSTVGDSHNFDLDFTERFPITTHPDYGYEVFVVRTPAGDVYVPTSVPGKVRAEDVVSGRAVRQILSAFERQARDLVAREGDTVPFSRQPFLLQAASRIYQGMTMEQRKEHIQTFGISEPIHRDFILYGYESIDPERQGQLSKIIGHEYKGPVSAWLLNQLAQKQHDPGFSAFAEQIETWIEWTAEFLADQTVALIEKTRAGDMKKADPELDWPEEWGQALRELDIHHIILGSSVATEGQLAARFRQILKSRLKAADASFTLSQVLSDSKTAGIQGARDFLSPTLVQKEAMLAIEDRTPVVFSASHKYSEEPVDRQAQKTLAFQRPRAGVFMDLGDAVASKNLTDKVHREVENVMRKHGLTLDQVRKLEPVDRQTYFGESLAPVVTEYVAFEQTKNILKALLDQGVPVGVATGKPLAEVMALFGKELGERLYIYAMNGTVIHPPANIRPVRSGRRIFFSPRARAFINQLFGTEGPLGLGRFGFGPALVYSDKSDVTTYTTERRDFEPSDGPGSRINVTALQGDRPTSPNDHRVTSAAILDHIFGSNGFLDDEISADVAGRIGMDLSATHKGAAERDFIRRIEELVMPEAVTRLQAEAESLGIERPSAGKLDGADLFKLFDSYQEGYGQDARMSDAFSYTVGPGDKVHDHDVQAPVVIGGGPVKAPEVLSQTRFVDSEGRVFRVGLDGKVQYEEEAGKPAPYQVPEIRRAPLLESVDLIRSRTLGVEENGETKTVPTRETQTGWAFIPEAAREYVTRIQKFAASTGGRYERIAVIGMGGPGNASSFLISHFDGRKGTVIDHIDPFNLKRETLDLKKTLFVVLSKSGTTPEILAMMHYFKKRVEEAGLDPRDHFAVVTDQGTPLDGLFPAERTFVNDLGRERVGDIGGRFSVGTYFGLLPAALSGMDPEKFLQQMEEAAAQYRDPEKVSQTTGVLFADAVLQARSRGKNKVTLIVPELLMPFGAWLEQLMNESLGKNDNPVVLIAGEPVSPDPEVYGPDRVFLRIFPDGGESFEVREEGEAPVIHIRMDPNHAGALAYHMMMAVSIIGLQLGINPFNQPAVQESKRLTGEYIQKVLSGQGVTDTEADLEAGFRYGSQDRVEVYVSPSLEGVVDSDKDKSIQAVLASVLGSVEEKQYVSLLMAAQETAKISTLLRSMRTKIRDRLNARPATMAGIISKDNHSNLQLHAAEGYDQPVIIQFTFDIPKTSDIPIPPEALQAMGFAPGRHTLTFGELNRLIAAGEFAALSKQGKKIVRIHMSPEYRSSLGWIEEALDEALDALHEEGKAKARSELRTEPENEAEKRALDLWQRAAKRTYHAEIADVDGNLTPTRDLKAKEVPPEVIEIFRRNILAGIPRALASVRSEETADGLKKIQDRVLEGLPPEVFDRFMLFPENGTFASWKELDAATGSVVRRQVDLAKQFRLVPEDYEMPDRERMELFTLISGHLARTEEDAVSFHEPKTYGVQIKVNRREGMSDEDYDAHVKKLARKVTAFLASHPDENIRRFRVNITRTTLLILPRGVNKSLAVRYFAARFGLKQEQIVGTDDQGDHIGNGWHLTKHAGGFSTNDYNPESRLQVPLREIFGLTGVDVWLRLQSELSFAPVPGMKDFTPPETPVETVSPDDVPAADRREEPTAGPRLEDRTIRLADYFRPEDLGRELGQVILISDNTGTLVPNYGQPLGPELREGIASLFNFPGFHFIVNTGDPVRALLDETYRELIAGLGPEQLARMHVVSDGGSRRTGFNPAYTEELEAWPVETRFAFARRLAELFYEQLKKRQGPLANLLSDVSDRQIDELKSEYLAGLDLLGLSGEWGRAPRGEKFIFDLLPPELQAKLGRAYVYDVGPKVTLDILKRLEVVPLEFTQEILAKINETFGDVEGLYTVTVPGAVDMAKTKKVEGVEEVFNRRVMPLLKADVPTLVIVMGDSFNDLPTFSVRLPEELNAAVIPVFLSRSPSYIEELPDTAVLPSEGIRGSEELVEFLKRAAGTRISEAPGFSGAVWTTGRSELREGTEGEKDAFGAWETRFRRARPFLGDYEARRWVTMRAAAGIYAIVPGDLAAGDREAVTGFVATDLFYLDGLNEALWGTGGIFEAPGRKEAAEGRAGLTISISTGIPEPEQHFYAIARLLAGEPSGYVHEFILDGKPEEIERLERQFRDEYRYAGLAGRYKLQAVRRADVLKRIRESVSAVYNQSRTRTGAESLSRFLDESVTISSDDPQLLSDSLPPGGWHVHNDLERHPAMQAYLRQHETFLALGMLEAELLKKLGEVKALRQVISASFGLVADADRGLIMDLWQKEMGRRWFYRSA